MNLAATPLARRPKAWALPALAAVLLVAVLFTLSVGSYAITFADTVSLVLRRLGTGVPANETHAAVLFSIRMPRVLLGVLVGSGLAVAGASMQGIFRNPLVDPTLLGVSHGAALGAVTVIVLGARFLHGLPAPLAPYVIPIAAFAGGLAAMFGVERIGGRSTASFLLAGIAINALAAAFMGLLTFVATDAQLRTITFWNFGSLGGATWTMVLPSVIFIVPAGLLLVRSGRALNALLLGEAEAAHLGLDPVRLKRLVFLASALIVGACVSVSGVLGFVGLVVPHVVRLVLGPDHRVLVPASALLGGVLMLFADAAARTVVSPAELPLGVLTAAFGTPFFLALLLKERRRLA